MLLSPRLGVKVGLVEDDPEARRGRKLRGRGVERRVEVDRLDLRVDIPKPYIASVRCSQEEKRVLTKLVQIVRLGDVLVLLQRGNIVHVKLDHESLCLLTNPLGHLLTLRLRLLKLSLINREPQLFGHQEGQIDREAISVVESPNVGPVQSLGAGFKRSGSVRLEELLSTVEGAGKGLFLLVENLLELGVLARDLGEEATLYLHQPCTESNRRGQDAPSAP